MLSLIPMSLLNSNSSWFSSSGVSGGCSGWLRRRRYQLGTLPCIHLVAGISLRGIVFRPSVSWYGLRGRLHCTVDEECVWVCPLLHSVFCWVMENLVCPRWVVLVWAYRWCSWGSPWLLLILLGVDLDGRYLLFRCSSLVTTVRRNSS